MWIGAVDARIGKEKADGKKCKMRKPFLALLCGLCADAVLLLPGQGPSYSARYSWQVVGGFPGKTVYAMHYDKIHDTLYVAAGNDGIWRCDRPLTSPAWTRLQLPEEGCSIAPHALAYDPAHNVLYTGDWSG